MEVIKEEDAFSEKATPIDSRSKSDEHSDDQMKKISMKMPLQAIEEDQQESRLQSAEVMRKRKNAVATIEKELQVDPLEFKKSVFVQVEDGEDLTKEYDSYED